MTEPTKERLAAALREAGLLDLAAEAERGLYDDYESPMAFPQMNLVHRLGEVGTPEALAIADQVRNGDFDGTTEEAEAWFKREGTDLFR